MTQLCLPSLFKMFVYNLTPRFNDTDALGHINNTSLITWFEEARRDVFQIFIPDLDPKKWNLILARLECDFKAQSYFEKEVVIKSYFEKVGNSSMILIQEAYQEETLVAIGKAVIVYFDYKTNTSKTIPDKYRNELEKHLK